MAYGLTVWNNGAVTQLDGADRITRVLGSLMTGTANGSFTIPGSETPLWITTDGARAGGFGRGSPNVALAGRVITWTFAPDVTRESIRILYGVY